MTGDDDQVPLVIQEALAEDWAIIKKTLEEDKIVIAGNGKVKVKTSAGEIVAHINTDAGIVDADLMAFQAMEDQKLGELVTSVTWEGSETTEDVVTGDLTGLKPGDNYIIKAAPGGGQSKIKFKSGLTIDGHKIDGPTYADPLTDTSKWTMTVGTTQPQSIEALLSAYNQARAKWVNESWPSKASFKKTSQEVKLLREALTRADHVISWLVTRLEDRYDPSNNEELIELLANAVYEATYSHTTGLHWKKGDKTSWHSRAARMIKNSKIFIMKGDP